MRRAWSCEGAGGSTLGNISAAQVAVKAVDIGLAQLAMHSAYELAGVIACKIKKTEVSA